MLLFNRPAIFIVRTLTKRPPRFIYCNDHYFQIFFSANPQLLIIFKKSSQQVRNSLIWFSIPLFCIRLSFIPFCIIVVPSSSLPFLQIYNASVKELCGIFDAKFIVNECKIRINSYLSQRSRKGRECSSFSIFINFGYSSKGGTGYYKENRKIQLYWPVFVHFHPKTETAFPQTLGLFASMCEEK